MLKKETTYPSALGNVTHIPLQTNQTKKIIAWDLCTFVAGRTLNLKNKSKALGPQKIEAWSHKICLRLTADVDFEM